MKIRKYTQFLEEYNLDLKPAKKILNDKKLSHSQRVAEMVIELENREDLYQAAFYHDYLERGGNIVKINKLLSPYSIELVKALSRDEGSYDTLENLKLSIKDKDSQFIQDVFLIKLVDRWDNLITKKQKGELNKKYLKKSRELVSYIYHNYPSSNRSKIGDFITNSINPLLNIGV